MANAPRPRVAYAAAPVRDSLELASLADSDSGSGLGSGSGSGPGSGSQSRSSLSSDAGISSSRRLSLASDAADSEAAGLAGGFGGRGGGRAHRSYSISSAFDFNTHLVPLSASAEDGSRYQALGAAAGDSGLGPGLERQKTLTFLNGLSLLVGLQIGSGIFSSPSQVNSHVPSPGLSLVVWAVAGVLAWTGAASYAELGGAIPLNGGSSVYLRHCFGELSGFLFSWTAVIVLKPIGAAIVAIISGEYINRVLLGPSHDSATAAAAWANKLTAFVCLATVVALNVLSTRLTTRLSDGMMFLKVGTLLAISAIGVVVAVTGLNGDGSGANAEWRELGWFTPRPNQPSSAVGGLGEYAIALYAGLWAFDGWDNVNYVTGEMRNPTRDLPRVIHTAMPVVIASYLLANTAYYLVLPGSVINKSNTVAVAFGTKVFGPAGGVVFAIVVSLSCFGALNATTFTSSRLVYVAGKEGYLPTVFGTLGFRTLSASPSAASAPQPYALPTTPWGRIRHARPWRKTPVYAVLLNAALTTACILVGEFGSLLTFYGVAGYSFYFLTVLGLIVLRFREPQLERPYRTWITTPVIFCCVSLFLILRGVFSSPLQTLVVCAFVAAGVPVYFWRVRRWRWRWRRP